MINITKIILFFCITCNFYVFATESTQYRLPTTVSPSHYQIELKPYFPNEHNDKEKEFTFDGKSQITIQTTSENISEIVLHSYKLKILVITLSNRTHHIPITSNYTELTQKLTIHLTKTSLIPNVDYNLAFKFIGILDKDMYGFYRSNYLENGVIKWAASTQMEATYARRVFPCFDEPSFKATFKVILNRPAHFQPSVSNTILVESKKTGQWVREIFQKTLKMSTYLLAFIVSEFTVHENMDHTFGIISRPQAFNETVYALQMGQSLLSKYNEWTQYNLSSISELKRINMAAIPDFSSGAMENWGLLTFRETFLLYNSNESSTKDQQSVATTISHEMAHMWFGDLVTCDWWSHLWLNEGFARYFEYFGTAMIETTWDLKYQFVVDQLQSVFRKDESETSVSMSHEVNSPNEIQQKFNHISYNKGASVLRMIEHIMGTENFHHALIEYLSINAYGIGTPEKLYNTLQKYTDKVNVTQFLNSWTQQSGFPLVTVQRHINDRQTVTVSQQRFLKKKSNQTDQTKWEIHLNYITPFSNINSVHVLDKNNSEITFKLDKKSDWVIFNVNQTGYYRVNYDTKTWINIGNALTNINHSEINAINRAQIVDDSFNLARMGHLNYSIVFNTIKYLKNEENYIPWLTAMTNFAQVTVRFNQTVLLEYQQFFINLSENIYNKLGFIEKKTDSRIDIYNRANILNSNCQYGNKNCIHLAKAEFNKVFNNKIKNTTMSVPPNLRFTVYCTAIAEGDYIEYEILKNKYLNENIVSEKLVILRALGCTRSKSIVKEFMSFIFSSNIRLQDKGTAFMAIRKENLSIVLEYLMENYSKIKTIFNQINADQKIIVHLASLINNHGQSIKLTKLMVLCQIPAGNASSILKSIELNLQWAAENVPEIYRLLKKANNNR